MPAALGDPEVAWLRLKRTAAQEDRDINLAYILTKPMLGPHMSDLLDGILW